MKRLLFLSLILSSGAMAQTITMDEALSRAMEHNLGIKTQNYEVKIQEESTGTIKKDLLPKLSAETLLETFEGSNQENSESDILFKGPLYRGGEVLNSIKSQKILLGSSEIERSITQKNTILEVKTAYYEGLKAMKEKDVILKSLKFYEDSYNKNSELYKLNLITKADLLAVKSELANRKLDLIRSENSIEASEIRLKKLMGMTSDTDISLEDMVVIPSEMQAITKSSSSDNLEVKLKEKEVDLAMIDKDNTKAKFKPKIDYHIGLTETQGEVDDTFSDMQGVAGITFSMDLFSWGQKMDDMRIADTRIEQQKIILKDEIEAQKEKFSLLTNDLESLKEGILQSKEAISSYEEKFRFYEESYTHKLISINDFLDSEQDLLDEKVRLTGLVYDYEIKKEEILTLVK